MRTDSAYKVKMIQGALRMGHKPKIVLEHVGEITVRSMRNRMHTLIIEQDRGGPFTLVDPDRIVAVHMHKLPETADE